MSTVIESEVVESIANQTIVYPVHEIQISEMGQRFLSLQIAGIDDKKGAKAVQEAKMECVRARSAIEKRRKELKAESLEYGRKVDWAAKALTSMIEPIEQHLLCQQDAVEKELLRIEKEKKDAVNSKRLAMMDEAGIDCAVSVREMSDVEFQAWFNGAVEKKKADAERARIAAEQAEANRLGAERLAKERAEFEAQQADQRRKQEAVAGRMRLLAKVRHFPDQAEIEAMTDEQFTEALTVATVVENERAEREAKERAELSRVATENAERIRQESIQKAREEAAENARIETERRIAREAQVREQERLAEEARIAREVALLPAKQKLNAFAIAVGQLVQPQISVEVDRKVLTLVNNFIKAIGRVADELE